MLLKKDTKGLAVVQLQCQLCSLGYFKSPIDGRFDLATDQATRAYQKASGLQVDGLVGKNTMAALDKATKDGFFALFLHCSATAEGNDLDANWVKWLHCEKKGWSRPGYSDVITLDGSLQPLRNWDSDDKIGEWEYTFGVKGSTLLNRNSRHVCYIGGVEKDGKTPKDTRTDAQKSTLETYIKFILLRHQNVLILGHNQVQRKACPSFDVPKYLRSIGVKDHNIGMFHLYKQLY